MVRKLPFFKILKNCQFLNCIFFWLSITNQFYSCFLLDITCTLVPAIELVSIWCPLERVSILVSFLHLSLDKMKNCKASKIKMLNICCYAKNGCLGEIAALIYGRK